MTLREVKPEYREMMAVQAIVEQGFSIPKRDMFVAHGRADGGGYYLQVVIRQGEREYTIAAAVVSTDAETFGREWLEAVAAYNAAPQAERTALMERSRARDRAVELMSSMTVAGFRNARLL